MYYINEDGSLDDMPFDAQVERQQVEAAKYNGESVYLRIVADVQLRILDRLAALEA